MFCGHRSRCSWHLTKKDCNGGAHCSASPQHTDQHRPQRPVLLATDEELGEGPGLPPEGADRVGSVEVGEAQDVDELGAGRWRAVFSRLRPRRSRLR